MVLWFNDYLLVWESCQKRKPKDECEASVDDDSGHRNKAHGNGRQLWWSLNCFSNDYQRCLSSPKTGGRKDWFQMETKDADNRFDFTPTTSRWGKRSRSSTNTTNLMKPMNRFKQVGSIEATAGQKSRWRSCWLWSWKDRRDGHWNLSVTITGSLHDQRSKMNANGKDHDAQ